MMARRLISIILTTILVLPSLYSPTFSMRSGVYSRTSTSPAKCCCSIVAFVA